MINEQDLPNLSHISSKKQGPFENPGNPATILEFQWKDFAANKEVIEPLWLKSCSDYLPAQSKSQYRNKHIGELY
jgi:hypothetical protein